MKPKTWMIIAAALAALAFLEKKKTAAEKPMIQTQNLFVDP